MLYRGIGKADAGRCLLAVTVVRRWAARLRGDHHAVEAGPARGKLAGLRLDDIDWRAGELVVRGKGIRDDRLPLPSTWARRSPTTSAGGPPAIDGNCSCGPGRRSGRSRRHGLLTVRRACRRAGIAEVGSHRLRHTVACEMVLGGVPLVQIAQVLRHHSLQSTAIYARVDLEQLRLLAAPWPGGAQR